MTKRTLLLAAVLLAFAAPIVSFGQSEIAQAQEALIEGVVTKVDDSVNKISIKHGPIKKFDMDGMTMVFAVPDPALLKGVKVGDKVKFDAERVRGQFTLIKLEKAK